MKKPILLLSLLFSFILISKTQVFFQDTFGPKGSLANKVFSTNDYVFLNDGKYTYRSEDGINWEKQNIDLQDYSVHENTIVSLQGETNDYTLLFSLDAGTTWTEKKLDFDLRLTDIAIDANNIVVSGDGFENRLWRTNDFGETWIEELPSIISSNHLFSRGDKIFSTNTKEILWFNNANQDWELLTTPELNTHEYVVDIFVLNTNVVFSTDEAVYSSQDFGSSWSMELIPSWSGNIDFAYNAGILYYKNYSGNLFQSLDFGKKWTEVDSIRLDGTVNSVHYFKGHLYYPSLFFGLFKYNIVKQKYSLQNDGLTSGKIWDATIQADSIIWAATGNGLFRYSIPQNKWETIASIGLEQALMTYVGANDDGVIVCENPIISNSTSYNLSTDFGKTWKTLSSSNNPLAHRIETMFVSDTALYAYLANGLMNISLDLGNSWSLFPEYLATNQYEIVKFNGKKWLCGRQNIYSSIDDFITYDTFDLGIKNLALYAVEDIMYLMTQDENHDNILYYTSDGENWTISNWDLKALFEGSSFSNGSKFTFFTENNIQYCSYGHLGFFASEDGGLNWYKVSDGFESISLLKQDDLLFRYGVGLEKVNLDYNSFSINPEFELSIYTENASGHKDSITLGYDPEADDNINTVFGEFELLGTPYDESFEARAALYDYYAETSSPFGFYYPSTQETKRLIRKKTCDNSFNWESSAYMLSVKSNNLPITISWDSTLIDDQCNKMTLIDWLPGGWFDVDGGSIIDMKDKSRYTFSETKHRTISGQDTLYNLFFTFHSTPVSTSNLQRSSRAFNIYPNPASDRIFIKTLDKDTNANLDYNIEFYNSLGQLSLSTKFSPEISLQSLSDGLYYYRVMRSDTLVQSGKIFKECR